MRLMIDGDKFNTKDLYLFYGVYGTISIRLVFIFTVTNNFDYIPNSTIKVNGISHYRLNHRNKELRITSLDALSHGHILIHVDRINTDVYGDMIEVWRLSSDEQLDIIGTIL
jgi:hypothetical protein